MLLVATLWPALLVGLILGGLVGALTGLPSSRPTRAIALILAALTIGLGGLAVSGLVAGSPDFWIEAAALILAAYLVGCMAGGVTALRRANLPGDSVER
jgi:uncharacterized membrane protein